MTSRWIVGLPLPEERAREIRENTKEERKRAQDARVREYIREATRAKRAGMTRTQWKYRTQDGKYRRCRKDALYKYRKKLLRYAYVQFGLAPTQKGWEDFQVKLGLIAYGWNPWTGHWDDSNVPSGRWELSWDDWSDLIGVVPEEVWEDCTVRRIDRKGHWTRDNIEVVYHGST